MRPATKDRLGLRSRPGGLSLMRQHWGKLLFMHWRIDEQLVRPLIPEQLEIDIFDGSAWIGVIPFTMWGVRASCLPPIPGTSSFHELNVRTYVYFKGVPGVWFFSLDAANRLAVWGARTFYHLPYFNAEMSLVQDENKVDYSSRRTESLTYSEFFAAESRRFPADLKTNIALPRAELNVRWTISESLPQSTPDSLEFFLTERYCLYSFSRDRLYRARIFHKPWPLQNARLNFFQSTMIESLGLQTPKGEPLLHYAEELVVDIWSLRKA